MTYPIRKASSNQFSPSRLGTTLTSCAPPLPILNKAGIGSQTQGFIVLETNYRLYAYTGARLAEKYVDLDSRIADNPLQIAVLNLFVTLKSRFPNLVIGAITRESVKKALANGITAEQVYRPYLSCVHSDGHEDNKLFDHARTPSDAQKCNATL